MENGKYYWLRWDDGSKTFIALRKDDKFWRCGEELPLEEVSPIGLLPAEYRGLQDWIILGEIVPPCA